MYLIDKILSTPLFLEQPLVLIDIGASGNIHPIWKKIAPYATCIAFDADDRDFDPTTSEKKQFKKLLIKKSLVNDQERTNIPFYLTVSPHCSSLLYPNTNSLSNWAYAPIFAVEKEVQLNTTTIGVTLKEFGIDYIDWYKSDSQGIDLRLFKSLQESIRNTIVVAEFEPGIIDAYNGEDKVKDMMAYQEQLNRFWLAKLDIKGNIRMSHEQLNEIVKNPFLQKILGKIGPTAPGWAEMTYLNSFNDSLMKTKRALMVGWISATILKQYGFAYSLATDGLFLFGDDLFNEMKKASAKKMLWSFVSFKYVGLILNKLKNYI
ncbi:MAG: hypothetical protein RL108_2085 [Bacteroidota bacterium]|jgi:hypothetical protein